MKSLPNSSHDSRWSTKWRVSAVHESSIFVFFSGVKFRNYITRTQNLWYYTTIEASRTKYLTWNLCCFLTHYNRLKKMIVKRKIDNDLTLDLLNKFWANPTRTWKLNKFATFFFSYSSHDDIDCDFYPLEMTSFLYNFKMLQNFKKSISCQI